MKKEKKESKLSKLENCYQQLYQAEANGDKIKIKIWKDVIKKLEDDTSTKRT